MPTGAPDSVYIALLCLCLSHSKFEEDTFRLKICHKERVDRGYQNPHSSKPTHTSLELTDMGCHLTKTAFHISLCHIKQH